MSGKGQPPKIGPERYGELLALLTANPSMTAAAQAMGVTRPTLYNLAARNEEMGAAMKRAQAAARARRAHQPSESCYVNNQCRTPQCTAAATEARMRRKAAVPAPATQLQRTPYELHVGSTRVNVYALLDDDIGGQPLADTA
ncbi:hypothetical protein ABZ619_39250 [Streptomyces sp. NPDC007851]|uniref:hypothetical protein n=1 Tax=Streptomyces sp. NPDC007851 TaxID=3155008 RepID=UPI0033D2739E